MRDEEAADPQTERIIAAGIEVHRHIGPGLLESIYEEALCHELALRSIPFEQQKTVQVVYKGKAIKGQRIDLIVFGEVVVDVKAVRAPHEYWRAQTALVPEEHGADARPDSQLRYAATGRRGAEILSVTSVSSVAIQS